jgi:hypothetical protein
MNKYAPNYPHLKAAENIMNYLMGTANHGIHFDDISYGLNASSTQLRLWFNRPAINHRLRYQSCQRFNCLWLKRHPVCAQSSVEPIARSTVSKGVIWFINLFYWNRQTLPGASSHNPRRQPSMHQDNGDRKPYESDEIHRCAILPHPRTIQKREQNVEFIKSTHNQADLFTKNLVTETSIQLWESEPPQVRALGERHRKVQADTRKWPLRSHRVSKTSYNVSGIAIKAWTHQFSKHRFFVEVVKALWKPLLKSCWLIDEKTSS